MRDSSSLIKSMIVSIGSLPRIFATSASDLPVSGLSFSDLKPTNKNFSGDPVARYKFSQASESTRTSAAIFSRVAGSRNRLNNAGYPPSSVHGGRQASSPVPAAGEVYLVARTV